MATNTPTQQQLEQQAMSQLMIIGGQLTREEDVTFEGTSFNFPARFRNDHQGLLDFVMRYIEGQQEMILLEKTFEYRPKDGANATYEMLKRHFGFAQSQSRNHRPPQELTIDVGYKFGEKVTKTVPWGDMVLPVLRDATLTITEEKTRDRGTIFKLVARVRRVEQTTVIGFFKVVEQYLKEHSIYKGKAVYGDMSFIDTDKINPEAYVYTEDVWADAETLIFSAMADANILAGLGMEMKRVYLLEGLYGTGKSGLLRTSTKVAVDNEVTAIIARPGQDDPFAVLQTARLYQPSLVCIEDVDTFSSGSDPTYNSRLLDAFDGFGTKDLSMMMLMTTNHADKITKGMLRPGRIHGIISIGAMDRPGVEKLTKLVIGDALEDDIDFDAVFAATDGYMPAYVREGLERAVRYTVRRLRRVGKINTDDLVRALKSLRPQLRLQDAANDHREALPPLDQQFRQMFNEEITVSVDADSLAIPSTDDIADAVASYMRDILDNTKMLDVDGDRMGRLDT